MAKTLTERQALEDRIQRMQDELESIATRKSELACEANGLTASLPPLQYKSKVENDAAASEALRAAQDHLADIQALVVGFEWRREEVQGLLVALDAELSGRKRAEGMAKLREAEGEIQKLKDTFISQLCAARKTQDELGVLCEAVTELELAVTSKWDTRKNLAKLLTERDHVAVDGRDEAMKASWNHWRRDLGHVVVSVFDSGKYQLPLVGGGGAATARVHELLKAASVRIIPRREGKNAEDGLREFHQNRAAARAAAAK